LNSGSNRLGDFAHVRPDVAKITVEEIEDGFTRTMEYGIYEVIDPGRMKGVVRRRFPDVKATLTPKGRVCPSAIDRHAVFVVERPLEGV
jgi:hypothetical protein